jgi:general secretion pathway protein E
MNKSLDEYIIDFSLLDIIDIKYIVKYEMIPLYKYDIYVLVASTKELDIDVMSDLFSYPVKLILIDQNIYDEFYNNIDKKISLFNLSNEAIKYSNNENLEQNYISRFCDTLFLLAIEKNASDIHIQSTNDSLLIRFRIEGVLIFVIRLEYEVYPILSSLLKLLSSLDISLVRLPQNGRFTKVLNNKKYDFRISILPSANGESIVLRILDNEHANIKLHDIGFNTSLYNIINNNINASSGMILVTGPTGSGKTTTLYSMLNSINKKEKKIITVEDPIEYKIDDITQININNEIGLNYANVLKNSLRQDPDVLLIGEIRDKEALDIAIQAALTGHLVIATLHTNDAIETLNRLYDLGAKSFLLASVLKLVISQRLYRVLCTNCKKELIYNNQKIYQENKCVECNYSGYLSRNLVAQYLIIDKNNAKYIKDTNKLREFTNIKSLNEKLYEQVLNGTTSLNEYYKNEI